MTSRLHSQRARRCVTLCCERETEVELDIKAAQSASNSLLQLLCRLLHARQIAQIELQPDRVLARLLLQLCDGFFRSLSGPSCEVDLGILAKACFAGFVADTSVSSGADACGQLKSSRWLTPAWNSHDDHLAREIRNVALRKEFGWRWEKLGQRRGRRDPGVEVCQEGHCRLVFSCCSCY